MDTNTNRDPAELYEGAELRRQMIRQITQMLKTADMRRLRIAYTFVRSLTRKEWTA